MPSRTDIVESARKNLGIPWRHQGRSKTGLDCLGLLIVVADDLGIPYQDEQGYQRRPNGHNLVNKFKDQLQEISIKDIQPGDALIFADEIYPCHVAIVSEKYGKLHIIHAHATRRKVLEEQYGYEWPNKLRKAFRFPGVEA